VGQTSVEVAESFFDAIALAVVYDICCVGGERRQERREVQNRIVGNDFGHGREVMMVSDDPFGQGGARRRRRRGRQREGCPFGRRISTSTGVLGGDVVVLVDNLERVLETAPTAADGHAYGLGDDGRHFVGTVVVTCAVAMKAI